MSQYHIKNLQEYLQVYKKSIDEPETFWAEIAEEQFIWHKKWNKVLSWDFTKPEVKWFEGAQLNITENCLDRHLITRANKTAIIFEPNHPNEKAQHITYAALYEQVCKMANVLKAKGVQKGDRVCIYLPMIPELTVAILACARIGAVHSVVFAGFSATALATRINDCNCKMMITSDGSFRGAKTLNLKQIVDDALVNCKDLETVLVVKRTGEEVQMEIERDFWLEELLNEASPICPAEIMAAEDPLFILYTSGSTGKPKGMLHTTAGYMVYTAYTFKNVFQYEENDVYWCTADVGWITGHSYIIYGPLCNGATSVMFEGVPSFPDYSRFWQIVEKHNVNQFYTAPTAIRALAKEGKNYVEVFKLKSLKVIGTVGEPINEEAWKWYNEYVGKHKCPVVDTWFQTETGGIMITPIPYVTPTKPTFATLPFIGVQLALMDDEGKEFKGNQVAGRLTIKFPWPSMARSIWGDHERYKNTYFSTFKNQYFTGDGALRDATGFYRITGRVDDIIIVSGHNLGTAPIEDAINEHEYIAESAVVGFPHEVKGNALYGFITLKETPPNFNLEALEKQINTLIATHIGPIAKLDKIQFTEGLPKTRSGKIMRRILRKIAENKIDELGDISTLLNPDCVDSIIENRLV
ncbi:acetate--CoA ligase [Aurantibacter aestuarii]|uniref:Acetate--CoA ligase n=1 Tax=Aurantibacter aestuarii TaxID=1266046 RepID=A0A2T1N524_9FLAO|nr:acetate--CoA ligase [Aurantibacter aestuarii]PSG86266.1 acetate--CoA ligase [Aurantibacter aestuarii]